MLILPSPYVKKKKSCEMVLCDIAYLNFKAKGFSVQTKDCIVFCYGWSALREPSYFGVLQI